MIAGCAPGYSGISRCRQKHRRRSASRSALPSLHPTSGEEGMGGVATLAWHKCPIAGSGYGLALLLLASVCSAPAAALSPDQTARVLAGMDVDTAELSPASQRILPAYARDVSAAWSSYVHRIGQPMRAWARRELPDTGGATIFYRFSGPDFATVAQLYPDAGRYVLVADQPACAPPALARLAPGEVATYLGRFREGWRRFASTGFFLTQELNADAGRTEHRLGVTALLMAFAALEGFEVTEVQPIRITEDGAQLELRPGDDRSCRTWDSVRLTLARDGLAVRCRCAGFSAVPRAADSDAGGPCTTRARARKGSPAQGVRQREQPGGAVRALRRGDARAHLRGDRSGSGRRSDCGRVAHRFRRRRAARHRVRCCLRQHRLRRDLARDRTPRRAIPALAAGGAGARRRAGGHTAASRAARPRRPAPCGDPPDGGEPVRSSVFRDDRFAGCEKTGGSRPVGRFRCPAFQD